MHVYLRLMEVIQKHRPELHRRVSGIGWADTFTVIGDYYGYAGARPDFRGLRFSEKMEHPAWAEMLSFVERTCGIESPKRARLVVAPCPLTPSDVQRAATEGKNTERDRILARLNSMKPGEDSYSKPKSEWERQGAMRMWQRIREAIVDGQEAHRDRDAVEGGK